MRQIRLGRTEASVSAVGLGTWAYGGAHHAGPIDVGWSGHENGAALAALARAAEGGINHWDTADVYGDGRAEELVGRALAEIDRSSIYLATKVGWDMGSWDHYYHPQLIGQRIERSLTHLGTEYVDLYYLHHCDFGPNDERLADALAVLHDLRDAGKIRHLGLSDWDASKLLRLAEKMDPDVIQVYRNVVDDEYATSGLAAWVRRQDAGAVFFSPLKHGLLLGKYPEPCRFPSGDMRNRVRDFRDAEALDRYRAASRQVAERFAAQPHPILYALVGALLGGEPRASVLVGQRNREQAAAAVAVGEKLTAPEIAWVRERYGGR